MSDVAAANAASEASEAEVSAAGHAPVPGRLSMMTAMAVLAGSLPLPLLPGRALRQLRGAVAHEVASRHGLSLSGDARDELARPGSDDRMRYAVRRGIEIVVRRVLKRVGPLAPLSAALNALELFALGHLADRYFARARAERSARVQLVEAQRLRGAIDAALVGALSPSVEPTPLLLPQGVEDLRDSFTRWFDLLLIGGATLPSYIIRRLDAAFDEVLARSTELRA